MELIRIRRREREWAILIFLFASVFYFPSKKMPSRKLVSAQKERTIQLICSEIWGLYLLLAEEQKLNISKKRKCLRFTVAEGSKRKHEEDILFAEKTEQIDTI